MKNLLFAMLLISCFYLANAQETAKDTVITISGIEYNAIINSGDSVFIYMNNFDFLPVFAGIQTRYEYNHARLYRNEENSKIWLLYAESDSSLYKTYFRTGSLKSSF